VTAVIEVGGRGFVLADPAVQDTLVAGWGRVLGGLCRQEAVVRVQVLHRVTPGGGAGVRRWWAEHATGGASWAAQVVADVLAETITPTDRHQSLIAFALRTPRSPRRGHAAAVEGQLAALAEGLRAADLDVEDWLSPPQLRRVIRSAYDPGAADLDHPLTRRDAASRAAVVVGPMGLVEDWDRVRTDTAWQAVYWVSEWPRTPVRADVLHPLLLAPGVHGSLALIAEPLPVGRALREIRRARVAHASDAIARARAGRVEEKAILAEVDDITRRERDLVAGHGDLRFTGLLTVTAATSEGLDAACAVVEAAAAQALCEVRRLVGQQVPAHTAAALPLAAGILR
jgi:hypothetical protein